MSYRDFLQEMKKGLAGPAYLLASSDPFLHSEAGAAVRGLVPPAEIDFNFHVFDMLGGGAAPLEQVLDVLNTVPFFSGRKFVVVENAQKLLKKDLAKLSRYLAAPSESAVLVLLYSGQVKKEAKEALKGVRQITLDISERDMLAWVKERSRSKGIVLTDRAADYLLGTIGPDLGLLASEIDKCGLMDRREVDVEDLMDVVESKRTFNAFALIDAIRARDEEQVFKIYRVLRETEEPYALLGALNWQFAKSSAERTSARDRAYFFRVFTMLKDADLEIKSSGGAFPLELLLVRLMQASRQR